MNRLLLSICTILLFSAVSLQAQTPATDAKVTPAKGPKIKFTEEVKNFGEIKQGDVVKHVFSFKNTGTEPLILSNVATTCGCTASNWPKEPIMPGKTASIEASFNSAGKIGQQNKVLTVYSNSVEGESRVSIQCNVVTPPSN